MKEKDYDLALEDFGVDLECEAVDNVEIGIKALS
jgi:hypothetical protein